MPLDQLLPTAAFGFMLILSRVSAAVMLLPGLGEAEPPAMLRAGLSLAIAALLAPALLPSMPAPSDDPWRDLGMVAAELGSGLLLGWLARLIALAMPIAGQIIAVMTGLTSVLQPDPALGAQTAGTARLLSLAAIVVILGTGLYAMPIMALAGSYRVIPAGTLLPAADSTQQAIGAVSSGFALALRLAAPFVVLSALWHFGLGVLSRLVPQLQVYFLAAPAQILGGLLLFALLTSALLGAWSDAARQAFSVLPGL